MSLHESGRETHVEYEPGLAPQPQRAALDAERLRLATDLLFMGRERSDLERRIASAKNRLRVLTAQLGEGVSP